MQNDNNNNGHPNDTSPSPRTPSDVRSPTHMSMSGILASENMQRQQQQQQQQQRLHQQPIDNDDSPFAGMTSVTAASSPHGTPTAALITAYSSPSSHSNLQSTVTHSPIVSTSGESPRPSAVTTSTPNNSLVSQMAAQIQMSSSGTNEALLNRYIQQLLYGCHSPICTNPFCASNPGFQLGSSQEITNLAATLARSGSAHLCNLISTDSNVSPNGQTGSSVADIAKSTAAGSDSQSSGNISWTVDTIMKLINESTELDQTARLMRVLYSTFSSSKPLLKFFQIPPFDNLSSTSPKIDKEKIKMAFHQIISKLSAPTINCIMTSTACLIDTIKLQAKYEPDDFVSICVILCNPALLDSNYHSTVLIRLCDLMSSFAAQKEVCEMFERQLARFFHLHPTDSDREPPATARKDLQMLVGIIQHFISMRIYTLTSQFGYSLNPNKDEPIISATKTLDVFYKMNEKLKMISYEEFYNDAINENLEIKDDFPHWKAKEGFSFCNYPFVLNPSTKSDILKVESMVQMRHELQDAFFRAMFIGVNSPYLVLEIRRDHIIRDALYQLENKRPEDLKKQLKIQFVGEDAVDEGGVQKEFFQLAIREIFNPQYNLFSAKNHYHWLTLHPENIDKTTLEEMRLVGMLIGLAIYNGVILDVRFPPVLYKKLMGISVDLDDLNQLDPVLTKSLRMVLEYTGDVEADFSRSFNVDLEIYSQVTSVNLIPNGENIPLTKDNREEFVKLYVDLILNQSVEAVFNSFKSGFEQVCKNSAISLFRAEELELLVCGSSADLNFEELMAVTTYDGGYSTDSPVIQFFWNTVLKFNTEQKKRLLFFATGTDRIPIGGLSKMTFCIAKNGPDSDRLPTSHTCFNVLLLPEYKEQSRLEERLLTAIQNAEGFGMI